MTLTTAHTAEIEQARVAFDRQSAGLRTALPGIVQAVHANGTLDVQPAILQVITLDGVRRDVPLSVLSGVPTIFAYYAQTLGLSITLPLAPGDEGLLIVADRSIDYWQVASGLQSPSEPVSPRHHNLLDALFLPGAISEPKAIANVLNDGIQLRNRDASTHITLNEDRVLLQVGSSTLSLEDGAITLTAGGSTLRLAGDVQVQSSGLSHNGITVGDSHVHGGVTPGNGQTGPPR